MGRYAYGLFGDYKSAFWFQFRAWHCPMFQHPTMGEKEFVMLVLSREKGESIVIAGGIRITVTEIRGGKVRLSIEAPQTVRVLRQEIADRPSPPSRK